MAKLRIATRASDLALWQAHFVARRLAETHGIETEIVQVSTIGDRDKNSSLANLGGTGVFTKEIQRAVLNNQADIAVHSLKDLPTQPTPDLLLAAFPVRASRYDVLVFPNQVDIPSNNEPWTAIPKSATIGTGSPRRQSQLLRLRPDVTLCENRGNLNTRLKKLDNGEFDAIILASAGLERLKLERNHAFELKPPYFFPAVGQGILGVECRPDDQTAISALATIDDQVVRQEALAERSALRTLKAGCHAPVGVHCSIERHQLRLEVVVLSLDGTELIQATVTGQTNSPEEIGKRVAQQIINQGGERLL